MNGLLGENKLVVRSHGLMRCGLFGKGIHLLNWDCLSMRKEYGGMGFRHLYGFNLAMLGKQGWKFTSNHDAIVLRVFKA